MTLPYSLAEKILDEIRAMLAKRFNGKPRHVAASLKARDLLEYGPHTAAIVLRELCKLGYCEQTGRNRRKYIFKGPAYTWAVECSCEKRPECHCCKLRLNCPYRHISKQLGRREARATAPMKNMSTSKRFIEVSTSKREEKQF